MNRFKEARTIHNQHGKQSVLVVAKETGITRTLIDDLEIEQLSKQRDVGYRKIAKLADYYGVSVDWLVGLSDSPSINTDDKFLTDKVGFTHAAVGKLKAYHEGRPHRIKALSTLLEQDDFGYILDDIAHCAEMGKLESLFEQSFAMNEKKPDNYEKELIRYDRNIHKTAAIYSPQLKLAKICERIIDESEKEGGANGK